MAKLGDEGGRIHRAGGGEVVLRLGPLVAVAATTRGVAGRRADGGEGGGTVEIGGTVGVGRGVRRVEGVGRGRFDVADLRRHGRLRRRIPIVPVDPLKRVIVGASIGSTERGDRQRQTAIRQDVLVGDDTVESLGPTDGSR